MTRRSSSLLLGEAPGRVLWSPTGARDVAAGAVWAGYVADRALLGWTFVWLGIRWARRGLFMERPEALYDPLTWLGGLVFPAPPSSLVWYALFLLCAACAALCLWRPQLLPARIGLAAAALLLMVPEFAYGHVEHVNHLFLLGHTLAVFLPVGRPVAGEDVILQARAFRWYLAGLLFPYTMAGLWKWVDMLVRPLFVSGMTWLHAEALPVTSAYSYLQLDLPLDIPMALADYGYLYAIGYVLLSFVFSASSLAAFRRPLLFITLPAILLFHLTNVFTLRVLFISTCAVALVLFTPYEWVIPGLRRRRAPVAARAFSGAGAQARYERRYENGDEDVFLGFYAYRERLGDRSTLLAAPLYYPGVAWLSERILQRRARRHESA